MPFFVKLCWTLWSCAYQFTPKLGTPRTFYIFNSLLCSDVLSNFLHILFRVNNIVLSIINHSFKLVKRQTSSDSITLDMIRTTSSYAAYSSGIFAGNWEFVPEGSILLLLLGLVPKCSNAAIFKSHYIVVGSISWFTRHLLR